MAERHLDGKVTIMREYDFWCADCDTTLTYHGYRMSVAVAVARKAGWAKRKAGWTCPECGARR